MQAVNMHMHKVDRNAHLCCNQTLKDSVPINMRLMDPDQINCVH